METPKDSPSPQLRRARGIPAMGFCCEAGTGFAFWGNTRGWLCIWGGLSAAFGGGQGLSLLLGTQGTVSPLERMLGMASHLGDTGAGVAFEGGQLWGRKGWVCIWQTRGLALV